MTVALVLPAVLMCALIVMTIYASWKYSVAGAQEPAAAFDGKKAFQHLRRLVDFGPRPPGSAGAEQAQEYLVGQLKKQRLEVRQQLFTADTPVGLKKMKNVIGIIKGSSEEIIIMGAHYDTKHFEGMDFVGANDGASGPAILLELARCLGPEESGPAIWLVFFDGEEAFVEWSETDSLYGSRHFVQQLKKSGELPRVKAMVLLDMVGDAHLTVGIDLYSSSRLRKIIWENARRLGYEKYFVNNAVSIADDHIPFLKERIPALNIIDFQYGPQSRSNEFWHTPQDTLDKVSPESLAVVGQVVLAALPEIAAVDKSKGSHN